MIAKGSLLRWFSAFMVSAAALCTAQPTLHPPRPFRRSRRFL